MNNINANNSSKTFLQAGPERTYKIFDAGHQLSKEQATVGKQDRKWKYQDVVNQENRAKNII